MAVNFTQNLLQKALFQAAKAGNIELMREFITAGANPFELDEKGNNALFYANLEDSVNTAALLLELHTKENGA
jgi:ankyrin repeat protein